MSRLRLAGWNQAFACGIGKGGLEALVLGLVVVFSAVGVLVAGDHLSAVRLASLAAHSSAGALAGHVLERAFALVGHVFSTVVIVYSVRTGAAAGSGSCSST